MKALLFALKTRRQYIDKIKQAANEADAANAEVRKRYEAGDIGLGSNLLQQGGNNAAVASGAIGAGYDKAASLLKASKPCIRRNWY